MFALACETGWNEDYILDLPLDRALRYQHCALRRHGAWTIPMADAIAERARLDAATAESLTLARLAGATGDGGTGCDEDDEDDTTRSYGGLHHILG